MKKIKVLIVEDHALAQHMLQLLFANYAAECDCVGDGTQALEAVQQQPYDLIVVDLGLPDQSGFDLAQQLRQQGITTPLLALTSQLEPEYQSHPQRHLFIDILEKPLTGDAIASYFQGIGVGS